jgi:transposase
MRPSWLPYKEFTKSSKRDITISMEVPDGDYERYRQQYPGMRKQIKCRLVKIQADNGEEQILCTSLLDTAKYKLRDFGELYRRRWGIEEGFKMYKARVQVEAFSGKTATAVKQDIYAKAMMMTLCAALAFPIEERVVKEYKSNPDSVHPRKINRTFAYWSTKTILIGMFIKKMFKRALTVFDKQVKDNTEIVRPGRSSPRKKRPPRLYHMNYKDL